MEATTTHITTDYTPCTCPDTTDHPSGRCGWGIDHTETAQVEQGQCWHCVRYCKPEAA